MLPQLLIHLWGDYLLQSDWMAKNKVQSHLAAAVHATVYSLGFLLLRPSPAAFAVILCTHFLIDRYRVAKYVVWAKNWLGPVQDLPSQRDPQTDRLYPPHRGRAYPWEECSATGYPMSLPTWMTVWLLIIADNTLHLTINYLSLRFL